MAESIKFQIASGQTLLIDAEDFERLNRYTWKCQVEGGSVEDAQGHGQLYYVKGGPVNGMARFILGLQIGDGLQAHHVNDNHLDMRKQNLKALTVEQHQEQHGENHSGNH